MSAFFFVVKTVILTVVIVILLQVRVGRSTIEEHSLAWMHRSQAMEALRGVADGAVAAGINGFYWVKDAVQKKLGGGSGGAPPKSDRHSRRKEWEEEASRARGDEVE